MSDPPTPPLAVQKGIEPAEAEPSWVGKMLHRVLWSTGATLPGIGDMTPITHLLTHPLTHPPTHPCTTSLLTPSVRDLGPLGRPLLKRVLYPGDENHPGGEKAGTTPWLDTFCGRERRDAVFEYVYQLLQGECVRERGAESESVRVFM